jgi:hypothetical protein
MQWRGINGNWVESSLCGMGDGLLVKSITTFPNKICSQPIVQVVIMECMIATIGHITMAKAIQKIWVPLGKAYSMMPDFLRNNLRIIGNSLRITFPNKICSQPISIVMMIERTIVTFGHITLAIGIKKILVPLGISYSMMLVFL